LINPTAVIDTTANLGQGVSVGHYSIIGANVELGDDTWIGPHVVIKGPTRIGRSNKIFQFSSIGDDPQDKKYKDDSESILEIGDGNVIREYCSINRGTQLGGGRTVIGNDNWIMANVHIAHDCIVGNQTIFANYSALAGHVKIDDFVIMGGYSGVHQFCHVGRNCFTAVASVVVKDVPPFLMISGNTAKPYGLNREGLKRNGYSKETIEQLRKAYKMLYRKGLTTEEALKELKSLASESKEVACFVEFIEKSERGIVR
jgi:UDP-N-acetylglucosamine acyltransferase